MENFFNLDLKRYGYEFLFQCNCKPDEVNYLRNSFLREVVQAWCEISYVPPKENYGIQIVWNTSDIRINGKVVFYKFLFDKNVKYVKDFFDGQGNPLSFENFKRKFNVTSLPFTLYYGLIRSILTSWRISSINDNGDQNVNEVLFANYL